MDMTAKLNQLFKSEELRVFSVGPFSTVEVSDLKEGKWTGFFDELPSKKNSI